MILNTMRQDWRNESRVTERRGRKCSAQPDVADESMLVNLIEGGALVALNCTTIKIVIGTRSSIIDCIEVNVV